MKKGFTLTELLVVIAILGILSGAAFVGYRRVQVRLNNNKVTVDLSSIQSAMEEYRNNHDGKYPVPEPAKDKNLLCFYLSTAYAHECDPTEPDSADFIQGQIDNNLLTKMYLQEVPTDPRTGARYAYGVTSDGKYYQIAGLIENEDGTFTAKVAGDLHFTYPLRSLIRSFNGPQFVMDGEGWLPFSPDHLSITAFMADITGTVNVNGSPVTPASPDEEKTVRPGSKVQTAPASFVTLYFSDGSVTYLGDPTQASELWITPGTEVNQNDKDGIITKIRLKLFSGKIWNKVVRLAEKSEFNVETTSAIAGVRGTEFGIDAAGNELIVLSGSVAARRTTPDDYTSAAVEAGYITFDSADIIPVTPAADGTFKSFYIPDGAGTIPAGTPVSDPDGYRLKYYLQPYNNNLQPRLNELDVPNDILSLRLFEKGPHNPFNVGGLSRINVYEKDSMDLLTVWDESKFIVDPVQNIVTILPVVAHDFFQNPEHDNISIVVVFEDAGGNLSSPLHPPLRIRSTAKLTWSQIFGDWTPAGGGGGGGGGTAPQITSYPTNVSLTGEAPLVSDIPCDWSIESGGGYFQGTYQNTTNVLYGGLDPQMPVSEQIADVSDRFKTLHLSNTKIRCTDPNDPSLYSEKTFSTSYEPFAIASGPNLSGYQYSWFAKGSTNWFEAGTICEALLEDGKDDWHLPAVGNNVAGYDRLAGTLGDNLTNPAEGVFWCGTFSGGQCSKMPTGVASIWLKEEFQGVPTDAYIVEAFNIAQLNGKPKTDSATYRGLRCVR